MKFTNALLTAFCLIVLSTMAIAQPAYESRHFGDPGTIYLYNRVFNLSMDSSLTMDGADLTWDFSTTSQLNTHPSALVERDEAIPQFTFLTFCALGGNSIQTCLSVWNNTNQAWEVEDTLALLAFELTDLQRFHRKTNNYLLENFLGFTVDLAGTPTAAVIVYQQPDTILQFPVTYQQAFTSSIEWSINLAATGQNIEYRSNQSRTTSSTAWGTIITPFDTFPDVIRVRSEILRMDTVISDAGTFPIELTQVEYMWFDTNYQLPVMMANGVVTDTTEILANIQYIYEATCPAPEWTLSSSSNIYYMDDTGEVNVDFSIENNNASGFSWNFGDGTNGSSAGSINHTYVGAGTYLVTATGCMEDCLPLNSCSVQTLEIMVVDTITSTTPVSIGELDIRLFPNPTTEQILIQVPETVSIHHYMILDCAGRIVKSGDIQQAVQPVQVDQLQSGQYILQLQSTDPAKPQRAIGRFVIVR